MIKLLVFDLDGTLINSQNDIVWAFNKTLEEFNKAPAPTGQILEFVGTGIRPLLDLYLNARTSEDSDRVYHVFSKNYLAHVCDETHLYDGILDILKENSLPKLILTNKSLLFTKPIVEKLDLGKYFLEYFGRESFKEKKPHPEPLLQISKKYQISPDHILMIGDTHVDIECANAAQTKSCGVLYGFGKANELQQAKPTWLAKNTNDLHEILKYSTSSS